MECLLFLCLLLGTGSFCTIFAQEKGCSPQSSYDSHIWRCWLCLQKGIWPRRVRGAEMQCTAGSLGVPGQGRSCLEEGTLPAQSFHLPLQIHSPPPALLCGLEGWPGWTASLTPNFWLGSPSGRCWQEIEGERICFSWLPFPPPRPPSPNWPLSLFLPLLSVTAPIATVGF